MRLIHDKYVQTLCKVINITLPKINKTKTSASTFANETQRKPEKIQLTFTQGVTPLTLSLKNPFLLFEYSSNCYRNYGINVGIACLNVLFISKIIHFAGTLPALLFII